MDDGPEATITFDEAMDCAVDAGGLGGVVQLIQSGAGAAGLTGEIIIGTFLRLTARAAIGWAGAAVVAWRAGTCLAKADANYEVAWASLADEQRRKNFERMTGRLVKVLDDFGAAYGDTAYVIYKAESPFQYPDFYGEKEI